MFLSSRQQGVTLTRLLFTLVVIGCIGYVAMRIVPAYVESYKVKVALDAVADQDGITQQSTQQIRRTLLRRLDFDDVYDITSNDIAIRRTGQRVNINVDYERRADIIGNIDLLFTFSHEKTIDR